MSTTMPALIVNGDVVGYYPPLASSIIFNNTSTTLTSTNIQDAIEEVNSNKASKSENNFFSDNQTIDNHNGTVSSVGTSALVLGNTTPSGTEGNSEGQITVCSDSQYVARLKAPSLTDDRAINFPDKGGTVALTSDIDGKVDTAGTGLTKNGTTISTYVPRVGQDVNTKPGQFRFNILEYNNASANIPTSHFYHILTSEGEDVAYAVQLALGMTIDRVFVRRCDANTWGSWNELAFKSDIRHWSSDSWVTQNSSYTFTDPELTQGSYLVSINGYDSYAQGLILAQRFNNGMTNIVELNTAPYFSVSFNSDNQLTVATDLAQGVIEVQKL